MNPLFMAQLNFPVDINIVDGALQNSARGAMGGTLNFCVSFMVIIWVVPAFAPVALIMAWLYIRIALPYIQASRDLRRLESISLSPVFAGFDELLMGLSHIRAFAMESRYQDSFCVKLDRYVTYIYVGVSYLRLLTDSKPSIMYTYVSFFHAAGIVAECYHSGFVPVGFVGDMIVSGLSSPQDWRVSDSIRSWICCRLRGDNIRFVE
jgi:hypothetical protein